MRFNLPTKITLFIGLLLTLQFGIVYLLLNQNLEELLHLTDLDQVQMDQTLQVFRQKSQIILVAMFAGLTIIVLLLARQLMQPIKEITFMVQRMAQGDLSRKIMMPTGDEIEDLSKAINQILEQIRSRMAEVMSNKSRFEAVLLSMFEGVMVVDHSGQILLINQTLKDLLHVKGEAIGHKPLEVIRNVEIQEIIDKVLKKKSGVESQELMVLVPEEKILFIHATPVQRDQRNEGAVLVFHDITDLRRLEKIRQDFVANVSHELRTPVATLKGYTETLLDGAIDDKANAKDFLKIMHADADRLAKLVNDLLDLARIESGKIKMSFEPHHLEDILDRVLLILQPQAKEKAVKLLKQLPKDLPQVNVDETSIAQALLNLIENAIKYNREGGSVTIAAAEKGSWIEVQIIDTGLGINAQDIPRIFERFYRVDRARSRELGGTGLGLSIVKHIAHAHGTEVHVESQLGVGSVFSLSLPKA